MTEFNEIRMYTKDLTPTDVDRAIQFNEKAKDEAIITYKMLLEQEKLPRKIFIEGYDSMYAASALFLAKKYKLKLDETQGGTHRNMRLVLDYYTRDSEHNPKLIKLFETAIEKYNSLSQRYRSEQQFANKVVKDLIDEGYHQGKKVTYYSEPSQNRKDPLELTIMDAKLFLEEIVKPFLFIMEKLTND